MGQLPNFVTPLHQATKRDYLAHMMSDKVQCMKIAAMFALAPPLCKLFHSTKLILCISLCNSNYFYNQVQIQTFAPLGKYIYPPAKVLQNGRGL